MLRHCIYFCFYFSIISQIQGNSQHGSKVQQLKISEADLENIFNQIQGQGRGGGGGFGGAGPPPSVSVVEVDRVDSSGRVVGSFIVAGPSPQPQAPPPEIETQEGSARTLSQVLPASETSLKSQSNAKLLLAATQYLLRNNELQPETARVVAGVRGSSGAAGAPQGQSIGSFELPSSRIISILPQPSCIQEYVECDFSSKYRTTTGICNHIFVPEYGSASSTFRRILDPAYHDSFNSPRIHGVDGAPLPSARTVSLNLHSSQPTPMDPKHSHMLMLWGQFLAHDISLIPQATTSYGGVLDCGTCGRGGATSNRFLDSIARPDLGDCFPIPLTRNDPMFGRNGKECMSFTRSLPGQLTIGTREQLNQITSFIDASNVYGSEPKVTNKLRQFSGGKMKEQRGHFPPPESCQKDNEPSPIDFIVPFNCPNCGGGGPRRGRRQVDTNGPGQQSCFTAGDLRNSENPALASMHTMWLREHNRIADQLERINPRWTDENIYQETRRIVGAMHQHITFNEFLPEIFGSQMWARSKLSQRHQGYFPCEPTVSNEFSTAAYRFGHSLINAPLKLGDGGILRLHEHAFNGTFLHASPSNLERIVLGMTGQNAQKMDRFLDSEIRNNLFGDLDLSALNIQRGRDHGLQPYVQYRSRYNLPVPKSWPDLISQNTMNRDAVNKLAATYSSVGDIDLYTGLLSETPMPGSLIGELLAKILTDQFGRLKDCDRFYYKNTRENGAFTQDQLGEFEKVTLSSIVCQNVDPNVRLPQKIMQMVSIRNPAIPCSQHAPINLSFWRNEQIYPVGVKMRRRKIKPKCLPTETDFIIVDPPRPIG